jgi:hypothetical protein
MQADKIELNLLDKVAGCLNVTLAHGTHKTINIFSIPLK